jgi:adenine/guanine phosphoribosyltransferase-like PRPP-binding protein
VVVIDDIVTTGATLAAITRSLVGAGIPVSAAAVLAATVRRRPGGAAPVPGAGDGRG